MKKTLLVLSTILAMSLVFVGCPKDPKDPPASAPVVPEETPDVPEETPDVPEETPDVPEETPDAGETEVVLFEVESSYNDEAHCKEIGNKTTLSQYAGKTYVLTIKYTEADRNGWGIGELFFATNSSNIYGSKTGFIEIKGTAANDNIATVEFPVDDVIEAMGEAEIISINLYNQTELVKVSVK